MKTETPMVVLHEPECPEDLIFLKKETARVHAGAVFWYLENSGLSAGEQIKILEELLKSISQ